MSLEHVFAFFYESKGADKVKKDFDEVADKQEKFAKTSKEVAKTVSESTDLAIKKTETWVEKEKRLLASLTAGQKRAYDILQDQNTGLFKNIRLTKSLFSHLSKEQRDLVVSIRAEKPILEEIQRKERERTAGIKELKQETDQLTQSSDKQNNKLKDLASTTASLVTTYIGFKKVISGVMNFAVGGEDLALMAQRAGVGAEELQKYGNALKNYGGGMSSAASTLSKLNSQLQDLKFGKGGAIQNVALRYGISVFGKNGIATAEEMLVNIAKRMESLNTQQQLDLGKKLGLDPATLAMVQGGVSNLNKELERASKLSLYSDEDIENSREFQRTLRELQAYLAKIGAILSRALLPPLKWVVEKFRDLFELMSRHKGFVLGFLGAIGAALGVIALKSILASLPLFLIIGAFGLIAAAIGAVVDDFITFKEGGDSCIGWVIDKFNVLIDTIKEFWGYLTSGNAWDDAVAKVKDWSESLKTIIGDVWDWVTDKIAAFFLWFFDKWESLKAALKGLKFWSGKEEIDVDEEVDVNHQPQTMGNLTAIGQGVLASTNTPLSTMNTTHNSKTSNNNIKVDKVEVNTQATDADGIALSISDAFKAQFQDLLFENVGGAY